MNVASVSRNSGCREAAPVKRPSRPQPLPATESPQMGLSERILIQSPTEGIPMTKLAGIVQQLQKERDQAARVVERLDVALAELNGGLYGKRTGHQRHLSPAGRARIVAAQRARWAKVRGVAGQKQNVVSMPKKRTMSAAARKRIAAAQIGRWAKFRAAKKEA